LNTTDLVLLLLLLVSCGSILLHWRFGVFLIVLWDACRDPIRKLLPEHLISLSVAGTFLWLFCLMGVWRDKDLREVWSPVWIQLRRPLLLLLVFLILSSISGFLQQVPSRVLGLGLASYLFPVIGLLTGIGFSRNHSNLRLLILVYVVVNSILIGTALLELAGLDSPVLGGIQMEWYRFRGDYSIPLPCGVYRSPDILGLHSAHVFCLVTMLIFATGNSAVRRRWLLVAVWAAALLVLSARRKMIGLSGVFLFSYWSFARFGVAANWPLFSSTWRTGRTRNVLCFFVMLFLLIFWWCARPQLEYGLSTLVEAPERVFGALVLSPLTTLIQSGFWGAGLGSATQGNTLVSVNHPGGWQEDGISRVVLEGGLPGGMLIISSVVWVLLVFTRRVVNAVVIWQEEKTAWPIWNVGLLCLTFGNVACYLVSHQHFSGDPVFAGLSGFWLGCVWTARMQPQEGC
jgi:hypothetical protein